MTSSHITKPTWSDVPDWANYMYTNCNGYWMYSDTRPSWSYWFGCWENFGTYDYVRVSFPKVGGRREQKNSLTARPQNG